MIRLSLELNLKLPFSHFFNQDEFRAILRNFILCLSLFIAGLSASTVAPQHPVNEFIRLKSIELSISTPGIHALPLLHETVEAYLLKIKAKQSQLSLRDQKRLQIYLIEFIQAPPDTKYPLRYKKGDQSIYTEFHYQALGTQNDSGGIQKRTLWDQYGLQIKGKLSPDVSYLSEGSIIRSYQSEAIYIDTYEPSLGLPYNTPESRLGEDSLYQTASFDSYRAIFSWTPSIYRLEFGNDWNQWGPGVKQHAGISSQGYFWLQDVQNGDHTDSPPDIHTQIYREGYSKPGESAPMPQVRLRINWGDYVYTQFAAQRQGLSHSPSAMLFGHRLDAQWGPVNIGIYEILSSAREDTDWVYFMPFVPFFVAEHHTGDRDNTTLGLDLNYQISHYGRIYTELFLDDLLSPGALLDNYWANKFAFTLGTEWVNLLPGSNILRLEYARVEPWLYTHHTNNNQFQHHGALIGSSLPPNSHQIFTQYSQDLGASWTVNMDYTFYQHQHLDRGSSILHIHSQTLPGVTWEDSQTKDFLGDSPETSHNIGLSVQWQNWRFANIELGLFHQSTQALNSNIQASELSEYGLWSRIDLRY